MTETVTPHLQGGSSAVLISIPHSGQVLFDGLHERLSPSAASLPDTDWFVDRLYAGATALGAGILWAPMSRYVVDLNRPSDDAPLYSQSETRLITGLVPLSTFDGQAIYRPGDEPGRREIRRRIDAYWRPYHDALAAELRRLVAQWGYAVLLDAHSIRNTLPLLFEGRLADFNLGSNSGQSASQSLIHVATHALSSEPYSLVIDGRFKGGYITRAYGQPAKGVHALQLEMAQAAYMQEVPPAWVERKAGSIQEVLTRLIQALLDWKPPLDHA